MRTNVEAAARVATREHRHVGRQQEMMDDEDGRSRRRRRTTIKQCMPSNTKREKGQSMIVLLRTLYKCINFSSD